MRSRCAAALASLLVVSAVPRGVRAQAAPEVARSTLYYAGHGALVGVFLGGVTATLLFPPSGAGSDVDRFPGDRGLRGRRSAGAAKLSDVLIVTTVAAPVFVQVGRGVDAHFANAMTVYVEATSASLFLNGLSKLAFRRPRPYTYGQSEGDDPTPNDRNVSFYSGHSSTAFVTAISGSLLFAETSANRAARLAVWGSELALAGATANLRVRAGKHYYSDVVVGALIGGGIGALVPLLHGGDRSVKAEEYAVAGGGLLLGVTVSQLLPLRMDAMPLGAASFSVSPWASPLGVGACASGSF